MKLGLGLLVKASVNFFSWIGLSLLFLLSACDEKLPKPSTKGANIFACKVNGKSWIADAGGSFSGKKISIVYQADRPQKRFVVYATQNTKKSNTVIQLALEDVSSTGTQYFAFDTNPYPGDLQFKNHALYSKYKPGSADYITNSKFTGSINVTRLDTANNIVAGTFEFTAENMDGSGETIKVTAGRFDIDWSTL